MIIAIDFDGTLVENKYPDIGKPVIFAFETLLELQNRGHRLILWTFRYGRSLDEAVAFCKEKGIEFYAVNRSYPEEVFDGKQSRKIQADIFIDDRNFGGLPDWGLIYRELIGDEQILPQNKKKGLFSLFKK